MQLGFLHDSKAKVEELKQEVDALTADVANFKNTSTLRRRRKETVVDSILSLNAIFEICFHSIRWRY